MAESLVQVTEGAPVPLLVQTPVTLNCWVAPVARVTVAGVSTTCCKTGGGEVMVTKLVSARVPLCCRAITR